MLAIKHYFLFFILPISIFLSCAGPRDEAKTHVVMVSLAPYKEFVERIAGDTVEVKMMVPSGGSPHSYEPTAREILEASRSDVWFQVGESFEEKAAEALRSYRSALRLVDLREGVDLITVEGDEHGHCHHHECADPHIWLSPRRVMKQGEIIAESLIQLYPENAEAYRQALRKFQRDLAALDVEIAGTLNSMRNRVILVSHPAYAYFCKDYGLEQVSIEFEGKEPSPQYLTKTLQFARENQNPFVFVQAQHSGKGAKLFADQIGAEVIVLDPLAEDYFDNMRRISRSFAAQ